MGFEQALRQASVTTDLGKDFVILERLSSSEHLSELFTIVADVIAPDGPIDFIPLLGSSVTVAMQQADIGGATRHFNGRLFEAQMTQVTDVGVHYRLTLRPWFALLSENLGMRIFQEKTVLDILRKLIGEAGFDGDYKCDAGGSYPPRTYCVQYRESDANFLARLMEEEGLHYYFEHRDGRHVLHVCDRVSQHPFAEGLSEVPYIASDSGDRSERPPHLWRWDEQTRPGAAKVTLRDYSFLQPNKQFQGAATATGRGRAETFELYDYPGGYNAYEVGQMEAQKDRYAAMRIDASRAERQRYHGQGDAFAVACGTRFKLTDFTDPRLNAEYIVVSANHIMDNESYRSGGDAAGARFELDLVAVPSTTNWRPSLRTPKPVVGGPQTATVVGPSGEVIHVDEHGRVKLQFHWDREGKSDDKSSCWIRVSQAWADGGFGTMLIPRIGEEVIVDFIDGDPDQPIITGRVYNPQRNVPYQLPANKTRSTWKSRTVGKSGDYSGAEEPPPTEGGMNEIRFEDKGGSEEFYEHAQRNKNVWIRLDEGRKTGRDVAVRVGRNRQSNVKANETLIVETGDETRTLKKGSRKTTIKKSDELVIQDGDSTTTVQSGNFTLTVSKGKVLVDAKQEILLKVGSNTLKLSPAGLEVKALSVKITADTSLSASGLTSELKASALVNINGMPVKIN
ncbi:MAG TPA: type VI secretion system tip protein TssI/VgrG [Rhizomicrobium sp.]